MDVRRWSKGRGALPNVAYCGQLDKCERCINVIIYLYTHGHLKEHPHNLNITLSNCKYKDVVNPTLVFTFDVLRFSGALC